jgi:hypothetical protein
MGFSYIAATRLQIFTMCSPRISVSHANCIRVTEPRKIMILRYAALRRIFVYTYMLSSALCHSTAKSRKGRKPQETISLTN